MKKYITEAFACAVSWTVTAVLVLLRFRKF